MIRVLTGLEHNAGKQSARVLLICNAKFPVSFRSFGGDMPMKSRCKKVPGEIGVEIPTPVAAILIGKSERRLQQLAAENWIKRPFTPYGVVRGYLAWRDHVQAKATKSDAELRLLTAKARQAELTVAERERELLPTGEAIAAVDAIVGPIKADLAGVPARATDDVLLRRKIEDAIDSVLAGLAARFEKAGADLRAGRDPLEIDAADDADEAEGQGVDPSRVTAPPAR
jgi:hypothetical protein